MRRGRPRKPQREKTTGRGWKFSAIRSSKRGWPYRRCGPKSCSRTAGSKRPIRIRSVSDGATPILSGKWPSGPASTIWAEPFRSKGGTALRTPIPARRSPALPTVRCCSTLRRVPNTKPRVPAATRPHLLIQQDFENRPNVGRISRLDFTMELRIVHCDKKDDRCRIQREPAYGPVAVLFFYAQRESRFAGLPTRCGSASRRSITVTRGSTPRSTCSGISARRLIFTPFRPARSGGTFLSTI